jgi:hypothetical protein
MVNPLTISLLDETPTAEQLAAGLLSARSAIRSGAPKIFLVFGRKAIVDAKVAEFVREVFTAIHNDRRSGYRNRLKPRVRLVLSLDNSEQLEALAAARLTNVIPTEVRA